MHARTRLRVRQGLDAERLLRRQPGLLADRRQVRRDAVEREAEALDAHDPQGLQQRAQRQGLIAGRHATGGGRCQAVGHRAVDRLPHLVDRLPTAAHQQFRERPCPHCLAFCPMMAKPKAVMAHHGAELPSRCASAEQHAELLSRHAKGST